MFTVMDNNRILEYGMLVIYTCMAYLYYIMSVLYPIINNIANIVTNINALCLVLCEYIC